MQHTYFKLVTPKGHHQHNIWDLINFWGISMNDHKHSTKITCKAALVTHKIPHKKGRKHKLNQARKHKMNRNLALRCGLRMAHLV